MNPNQSNGNKQVVKFVRKSNNLVEARYKFDIWEMRLFTKMLTMIRRDDEDFKDYKIYLKDIVNDFELAKNKEAYELLRRGAKKLMTKTFYIPYELDGVKRQFETPVISGLDSAITEGRGLSGADHLYLTISFHPKMKPYLLQLKSQFTMYDVRNILKLPSTYSIRIYELLKQYEKIGWRLFKLSELKSILGIEDKYKLYGHFKKRVIQKAQNDLSEFTDIKFTFEEIKKGRGVDKIKFFIQKNQSSPFMNQQVIDLPVSEVPKKKNIVVNAVVEELHLLVGKWMTKSALNSLLKKHPEAQVRNAIQYTLERVKQGVSIKNIGGHIVNMSKQATIIDSKKEQKNTFLTKKKIQLEQQEQKKQVELKLKQLFSRIYEEEKAIVSAIIKEDPKTKENAMKAVRRNRLASHSYDDTQSEAENLKKPPIQGAFINSFKKSFPASFIGIEEKYKAEIKFLKKQLLKF